MIELFYLGAEAITYHNLFIFMERYFSDSFQPQSIRNLFSKLYREGFIRKIKRKKGICFIPLKESIYQLWNPQIHSKFNMYTKKWDGKWWVLVYDIPEEKRVKREFLRRFIQDLGLGKIQKSCWVSPYDFSRRIIDFCRKEGLLEYICFYKGVFWAGKDIGKLLDAAWGIEGLFCEYRNFIKQCREKMSRVRNNSLSFKEGYSEFTKLKRTYKSLLEADPFLPRRFLMDWPRKEA